MLNAKSFIAKFSEKIANLQKTEVKDPSQKKVSIQIEKAQPEVKNTSAQNCQQIFEKSGSSNDSNSQKRSTKDDLVQIDLLSEEKEQEQESIAIESQKALAAQEHSIEGEECDDKSLNDLYDHGGVISEEQGDDYDAKEQKGMKIPRGIYAESENEQLEPIKERVEKVEREVPKSRHLSQPAFEDEIPEDLKEENNGWDSYNNYQNQGKSNDPKNNMGTLSQGRQYDQKFKRAFIKKLSKQISNEHPLKINQAIKMAAHSISVHLYQVKIWMISYKIVFSIQKALESRGGHADPSKAMRLIQKEVLSYLQRNRLEKKYRFVKILSYLFQIFNIKDKKASSWLTQFVNEHAHELQGVQLIQKISKNKSADEQSDDFSDNKSKKQRVDKKQIKMEKKMEHMKRANGGMPDGQLKLMKKRANQNGQNPFSEIYPQNIDMYPLNFKQKIASKINDSIFQSVDDIFRGKSEEFCLNYNTIKTIYAEYGDYSISKKQRSASVQRQQRQLQAYHPVPNPLAMPMPAPRKILNKPNPQAQAQPRPQQPQQPKKQPHPSTVKPTIQDEAKNQSPQIVQFGKLQNKLLQFLKINPNCPLQALEQESQSAMNKLGFPEKWKLGVRNQWFCVFLRRNKLSVSGDRRVICGGQRSISISPIKPQGQQSQEKRPPMPVQVNQNARPIHKPQDPRGQVFEMKKR